MSVLHSAKLVLPSGVVDGWLHIEGGRIVAVGEAASEPAPTNDSDRIDLGGRWVVPGFIDLHMHGGGGHSVMTGDADEALAAVRCHRAHGTTTTLAGLGTAELDDLVRGAAALADLCEDGHLAGIHYEGPFLAAARCGAHDPALLRAPDLASWERMLAAGRGYVRMITVAPELPGALDLIRHAVAAGVVVAIGHTDATYEQTQAGLEAGATVATHLFNGMRGLHHRDPGPVPALLANPEVAVELIADGVHLHDSIVSTVFRAGGADRVALVTDAMAAAGAGDGSYQLGARTVVVRDGVAWLEAANSLAGSTLTLDRALRRVVGRGQSMPDVTTALSATPARVLGLANEVGVLAPGAVANLVVLDADLMIDAIMMDGRWSS